ncbi:ATP-dependent helicase [Entomospira entomophila]|uniref:DNA 3'-5' helicase n=1 Tax=Entomospira entomophila TaxID=2719988 RepID=A0A968GD05_9SPIO|nr:ATP-dependent helicase [Entomospira entomophilus]NIZ40719.1 ATP-dependent helicase [Entomospira entomophilus]WDI34932.1 ATP-dependent helicase [Entomospira entomophilus]
MSLDALNPEQLQAVTTIDGSLLIIAGAGSGKTGVITHRIAYMLEQGIPQNHILALTFTNKAADEMTHRIKKMTGRKLSNLTIATFHAFGVKVLREQAKILGYRDGFSIYDSSDKREVIKDSARELGITLEHEDLVDMEHLFGQIKTGMIKLEDQSTGIQNLFREYQEFLYLKNAFDFDDLIARPLALFQSHPEILTHYQQRYRYIMVDEFQDTSLQQYQWIALLANRYRNLCVVGDDDQSIYSWRGANYTNIQAFEEDFPERMEIKLERNYRSTGIILEAANALIAHNTNRKEKELWTESTQAEASLQVRYLENDQHESEFICDTIRTLRVSESRSYNDFGVLSRNNSLMDTIEEAFIRHDIPYRRSGGRSFFERKEIRDAIAYLRLADNIEDDIAFVRIVNTPRRGVGKQALATLREHSDSRKQSLYRTAKRLIDWEKPPLSAPAVAGLRDFTLTLDQFRERFTTHKDMARTAGDMITAFDYWGGLIREYPNNDKVAKWKYDNIFKFLSWFERWEKNPDNLEPKLSLYLMRIALAGRERTDLDDTAMVNLMTIHAAKGLEFDVTFIAGVEDGILPSSRSLQEAESNMEEERRLFYVALTRAREKLFMTVCHQRKQMREIQICKPSPFLHELPSNLIETEDREPSPEEIERIGNNVWTMFKDNS